MNKLNNILFFFFVFFCVAVPALGSSAHNISVGTLFKNDAKYLKEWIEYHKLVGVDHFYLYNNDSEDNFHEILEPYIRKELVTLIHWPQHVLIDEEECLEAAYNHWLAKYGHKTKWMAFLKLDQFINPLSTSGLPEFIKAFKDYGALAIFCQTFGSSHIKRLGKNQLLTENFLRKAPPYDPINRKHIYLFRPKRCRYLHKNSIEFHHGYYAVDETQHPIYKTIFVDRIQINYYLSQDEEMFHKYCERHKISWVEEISLRHFLNQEEDFSIQRFIPYLRKNLGLPPFCDILDIEDIEEMNEYSFDDEREAV